jgi:hypothetical protein
VKNSQKRLYFIAMQFVDLLRNFVKQSQCSTPKELEDHPNIRNISQADLQKVFANKIKHVQACIDDRGHHFQQFY